MHHPTDRIAHTTAFITPVVEHWLERRERERDRESLCEREIAREICVAEKERELVCERNSAKCVWKRERERERERESLCV